MAHSNCTQVRVPARAVVATTLGCSLVAASMVWAAPQAGAIASEFSAAHAKPSWAGQAVPRHGVKASVSIPENERVGVAPVLMVHFNRTLLDHEKDWVLPVARTLSDSDSDSDSDGDGDEQANGAASDGDAPAAAATPKNTDEVGAWRWIDGRTLVWRPRSYLEAGTHVSVVVEPARHLTEPFFAPVTTHFTVAHNVTMRVDGQSHQMEVFRDGKLVKTIPVSLGKKTAEHETRSGTKVIVARHATYTMRGPQDDPYETPVRNALRLTYSGEFFHSAPWSVASQGRANVSHGCVNIGPQNAKWLYDNTLRFDPAEFVGTDRPMEKWNGPSGAWNWTWNEWRRGDGAMNIVPPV